MIENNASPSSARKVKSQSQRIRAILYKLWELNGEKMEFEEYYQNKTQKYIDFLLKKLNGPMPEE